MLDNVLTGTHVDLFVARQPPPFGIRSWALSLQLLARPVTVVGTDYPEDIYLLHHEEDAISTASSRFRRAAVMCATIGAGVSATGNTNILVDFHLASFRGVVTREHDTGNNIQSYLDYRHLIRCALRRLLHLFCKVVRSTRRSMRLAVRRPAVSTRQLALRRRREIRNGRPLLVTHRGNSYTMLFTDVLSRPVDMFPVNGPDKML